MIPESESYDRCKAVYAGEADAYDRLVSAEDCDGRLLPAIEAAVTLAGASALDVGAGTGRVSRLLAPRVQRLVSTDRSAAMLRVARSRFAAMGQLHHPLAVSDARALPFRSRAFDLATAGWVFGHLTFWDAAHWEREIGRAVDALERTVRPGGTCIVFETMGTAVTEPEAPSEGLADYYAWLESTRGYARTLVATDFQFGSVDEAAEAFAFFFGDTFAEKVRANRWARVPEWTGMWVRRMTG